MFSSVSDATFQAIVPDGASTFGLFGLALLALCIWNRCQEKAPGRAVRFVGRRTSELARRTAPRRN